MSYNSNYCIICDSSRRQEREMIAAMGVPEVWGLSPPRPEIELAFKVNAIMFNNLSSSDDDEVIKRREVAKMVSTLGKEDSSTDDSDSGNFYQTPLI